MEEYRKDDELGRCMVEWGWRYHHVGIPTRQVRPGETYLPHLKFSVSGFASSPFGAEWMRFDEECGMHELIQTVPHIAFVVEDLDFELATRGFTILTKPNPPSEGVRVAMIEHNGVPIELIEFSS